jgi:hypothetical protein
VRGTAVIKENTDDSSGAEQERSALIFSRYWPALVAGDRTSSTKYIEKM